VHAKNQTSSNSTENNDLRWRPPTHPGEIIKSRFFAPLDVTQTSFCKKYGIDKTKFNRLLKGKIEIDVDFMRDLGRAFSVNPHFFLDLQIKYLEAKKRRPDVFVQSSGDDGNTVREVEEKDVG